jgi:hypothetical protein
MENQVWQTEIPCARLPDVGRLGGAAGSPRSKTEWEREKERGRGNHTRKSNKNAAEGVCLSRRPLLAFISQRALVDTKEGR